MWLNCWYLISLRHFHGEIAVAQLIGKFTLKNK